MPSRDDPQGTAEELTQTRESEARAALQRYVLAQVEVWDCERRTEAAVNRMRNETARARLALPEPRVSEHIDLLDGRQFSVFRDEAGIVVIPARGLPVDEEERRG